MTDIHFFRAAVKPTWEDAANRDGGKLTIRLKRGLGARAFEWLILALVTRVDVPPMIMGVVQRAGRYGEDAIAVWVGRDVGQNEFVGKAVKEWIRGQLQLPIGFPIEYKAHNSS